MKILQKICFVLLLTIFLSSCSTTFRAEQGIAQSQNNLGWMYHKGQGVPQDYKEAIKWYRKSA